MNFEESNERLQEITKQLEKNELSLIEATKLYEEGVVLAKNCYKQLNVTKGKITILKTELENLINSSNDENNF
ncbi:MAG: exodeoxyribonuclease VII small subunit [Clostridia bacterium]|nr:exodeoxyribonuclease VII small subunit [Clostridia bacterium]